MSKAYEVVELEVVEIEIRPLEATFANWAEPFNSSDEGLFHENRTYCRRVNSTDRRVEERRT